MKRYCLIVLLGIFLMGCDWNNHSQDITETEIATETQITHNPQIYKTRFVYELHSFPERGAYVQDVIEESVGQIIVNDSLLPEKDMEFFNTNEGIVISTRVVGDSIKLKAAMYKALTEKLNLGLTEEDSKILADRQVGFDYNTYTQEDYDELLGLIVERFNE